MASKIQNLEPLELKPNVHASAVAEKSHVVNPLEISGQINDLRQIEDGWADWMQDEPGSDCGKAPSHAGLDWLTNGFESHYPHSAPLPYIYPTPEGGVQAEWSLGPQSISLTIDLTTHLGEWHRLDVRTITDDARELNLDDAKDWEWLVEEISRWENRSE